VENKHSHPKLPHVPKHRSIREAVAKRILSRYAKDKLSDDSFIMRSAGSINTLRPVVTDKRAAILRAAISVFAHNGYFNSKVADIAREAGVADGTVYLYFKSKEEILHSIFDRNMEEAIAEGKKQIEQISDAKEKLRRIALLHLERLGADRDLAVVFQVELRGSTKFMEEFSAAGFAEYLGLIRATFEEGQRAGVFRQDLNAKIVAKVLFGALDEMATNWILSKRRYKLAPMADQVLDIFLNGVSVN
jgi:TetR/AcrR family transcriptional regulator, fatty acid metabolism regulator protein